MSSFAFQEQTGGKQETAYISIASFSFKHKADTIKTISFQQWLSHSVSTAIFFPLRINLFNLHSN